MPNLEDYEKKYRTLYTEEAANYDASRFNHARGQLFDRSEQGVILRLLQETGAGPHLLDCAAGTGRTSAFLAQNGFKVTSLDLTLNMLLEARARAGESPSDSLALVEGNGRALPFEEGAFDAVISIRFLHLFPARFHRSFIEEMWRVLRPGGVLLVQLDSALSMGGLVTWPREAYRRWINHNKPRYYFWPHQLSLDFSGMGRLELEGFSFAGERFVVKIIRSLAGKRHVEPFALHGLPGFLANRVFVRARKLEA